MSHKSGLTQSGRVGFRTGWVNQPPVGRPCALTTTPHELPKEEFIAVLLHNFEERFPQNDRDIISAFPCLGLRPVSMLSMAELQEWGHDKILILCDQFGKENIGENGGIVQTLNEK